MEYEFNTVMGKKTEYCNRALLSSNNPQTIKLERRKQLNTLLPSDNNTKSIMHSICKRERMETKDKQSDETKDKNDE